MNGPFFFISLKEWEGAFSQLRDKAPQQGRIARQLLHLLEGLWWAHPFYGLDLLRVGLDPSVRHQETQQFATRNAKNTFFGFSRRFTWRRLANVSPRSSIRVLASRDFTTMSWMYASTFLPSCCPRAICINRWKVSPALHNPNGMQV